MLMIFPENWTVMNFDVFPDGKYISSLGGGGGTPERENAEMEVSKEHSEDPFFIF